MTQNKKTAGCGSENGGSEKVQGKKRGGVQKAAGGGCCGDGGGAKDKKVTSSHYSKGKAPGSDRKEGRGKMWAWLGVAVPLVGFLILAVLGTFDGAGDRAVGENSSATSFVLPATDGSRVSLDGVLADGPALLYFAMGVGCDICFTQIPEAAGALAAQGVRLVPIMVDDQAAVAKEAVRLGVSTPILIDADKSVSEAYDMIGIMGHSNSPTHSFALVDQDGTILKRMDYPDVFIPAGDLLADFGLAG